MAGKYPGRNMEGKMLTSKAYMFIIEKILIIIHKRQERANSHIITGAYNGAKHSIQWY
jgi:hypothetical protein